jgi:hypothetical protein
VRLVKLTYFGRLSPEPQMAHELMIPYERLNTMMNAVHPPGERAWMTSLMLPAVEPELLLALSERHRRMTEAHSTFKLVSPLRPSADAVALPSDPAASPLPAVPL